MFSKSAINTRAEPYNGPHIFGVGVNGSEEKGEDKKKVGVALCSFVSAADAFLAMRAQRKVPNKKNLPKANRNVCA